MPITIEAQDIWRADYSLGENAKAIAITLQSILRREWADTTDKNVEVFMATDPRNTIIIAIYHPVIGMIRHLKYEDFKEGNWLKHIPDIIKQLTEREAQRLTTVITIEPSDMKFLGVVTPEEVNQLTEPPADDSTNPS